MKEKVNLQQYRVDLGAYMKAGEKRVEEEEEEVVSQWSVVSFEWRLWAAVDFTLKSLSHFTTSLTSNVVILAKRP